jgi:hypothetical protein
LTLAFSQGSGGRGGTVLVDPGTGDVLHRWPGSSEPRVSARTSDGVAVVFPEPLNAAAGALVRLVVIDNSGRLRSVVLERIRISAGVAQDVALAVDPGRARVYVIAADAPVADVNLRTMHVSYHQVDALFLRPGEVTGRESKTPVRERQRQAIWIGNGRVAVFGRDVLAGSGQTRAIPAGVTLVDTTKWTSCTLDASASGTAFVAGRLLVFGPGTSVSRRNEPGAGLRAYTVDGRQAFHLFDGEPVWDVHAVGNRAYVQTPSALRVVNVGSGQVVSEIRPPVELVDLIAAPP